MTTWICFLRLLYNRFNFKRVPKKKKSANCFNSLGALEFFSSICFCPFPLMKLRVGPGPYLYEWAHFVRRSRQMKIIRLESSVPVEACNLLEMRPAT